MQGCLSAESPVGWSSQGASDWCPECCLGFWKHPPSGAILVRALPAYRHMPVMIVILEVGSHHSQYGPTRTAEPLVQPYLLLLLRDCMGEGRGRIELCNFRPGEAATNKFWSDLKPNKNPKDDAHAKLGKHTPGNSKTTPTVDVPDRFVVGLRQEPVRLRGRGCYLEQEQDI